MVFEVGGAGAVSAVSGAGVVFGVGGAIVSSGVVGAGMIFEVGGVGAVSVVIGAGVGFGVGGAIVPSGVVVIFEVGVAGVVFVSESTNGIAGSIRLSATVAEVTCIRPSIASSPAKSSSTLGS